MGGREKGKWRKRNSIRAGEKKENGGRKIAKGRDRKRKMAEEK